MSDENDKKDQSLVPAQTEGKPLPDSKQSAFKLVPDGKGGVNIAPNEDKEKKPDEKKKMPRGSTAFRHA